MKNLLFAICFLCLNLIVSNAQEFSYVWAPTGMKINVRIHYNSDSSLVLIYREASDSLMHDILDSHNDVLFFGDKIVFETNKVTLPLSERLYLFLPFDPSFYAMTHLDYKLDSLNTLSFILGPSSNFGLSASNPGAGDYYWCSCNMSTVSPGRCLATLETINGRRTSKCINDPGFTSSCVGWLAPLASLWVEGGGAIIEIKDKYGQNTFIEVD